jgi:hypothetical protein
MAYAKWNFDRASPLCVKAEAAKPTAIATLARMERKAALRRLMLDCPNQASLLRQIVQRSASAAAITQDHGHCAPLLIHARTNAPADS